MAKRRKKPIRRGYGMLGEPLLFTQERPPIIQQTPLTLAQKYRMRVCPQCGKLISLDWECPYC